MPDGRVALKATRPKGSIDDFIGFLAGKTDRAATSHEMNDAISAGCSGET